MSAVETTSTPPVGTSSGVVDTQDQQPAPSTSSGIDETSTPIVETSSQIVETSSQIADITSTPSVIISVPSGSHASTQVATTLTALTSDSSSSAEETASTTSGTSSETPAASPSAPATQSPSPKQLSAGSIAGIAVGSIVALVLVAALLLFAFGFRVRRAKWRASITNNTGPKSSNQGAAAAAGSPGGQHRKAELEDGEYAKRLERLHDGAKPELEGGWLRRAGWRRAFSVRSARSQPQPVPAELGIEPLTPGPYELPVDNAGSVRDC